MALILAVLVGAPGAWAQLQTGNLFGTVSDEQEAPLAGVTITLTGGGAPQEQASNAIGEFRFLGLSPGSYQLRAELEGFSTVDYPNITVNVGRNTNVAVSLSGAVEDVITVTAEQPILDERRISTGSTVSSTELEKIPTARDPWAVLQSTPGVLTDRINVGGNESGQQAQYIGPGSRGAQASWSVDGVVITDMAATGSSPAYFDFDSFEELQVTTGGSDSSIATGGVVLNIVTKRGTNEWRGSGRYLLADQEWQSDLSLSGGELGRDFDGTGPSAAQPPFKQGNRIVDVKDFGLEVGGPIVRDRLWIWGSYGKQEVDLLTIADVSDFTELESTNLKINAQIAASNSATLSALNSDKVKIGRDAGPTRSQPTTWNQSKYGDDPTSGKVEDTHIFSSNFYLTGMISKVNGGFQLVPQGGIEADAVPFRGSDLVWRNSFVQAQILRPQDQYRGDASTFVNTGSVSHELKFGASYREAGTESVTRWPGVGFIYDSSVAGTAPGNNLLIASRDGHPDIVNDYTSLYVQDTLAAGNLTANLGLRYDKQGGHHEASSAPANPNLPQFLPAVNFAGGDFGFEWESITPRLGLTYALGAERKTLLRASYSRFADQLGTIFTTNPIGAPGYVYFYTTSTGGASPPVTPITTAVGPLGYGGNVNPVTGGLLNSNAVDPSLDPPMTDELLLGVEHALRPEFVVGLNLTYRLISDITENELLVFDCPDTSVCASAAANLSSVGRPHQASDYTPITFTTLRPDGSSFTTTRHVLKPTVSTRNGVRLENTDFEQEYLGASLTFNKRLANRWMMRGNFTVSDWEWSNVPLGDLQNPTLALVGGQLVPREGDPVVEFAAGSGKAGGRYFNSGWSYSLNALYQVAPDRPWGFNIGANATGREGYPMPYFRRFGLGSNQQQASQDVRVTSEADEFRLDDVHIFDARIEKEFHFSDLGLTVGVDVFNLFNENFVMHRQLRAARANTNWVEEVVSPRILRIGARLSFR